LWSTTPKFCILNIVRTSVFDERRDHYRFPCPPLIVNSRHVTPSKADEFFPLTVDKQLSAIGHTKCFTLTVQLNNYVVWVSDVNYCERVHCCLVVQSSVMTTDDVLYNYSKMANYIFILLLLRMFLIIVILVFDTIIMKWRQLSPECRYY
jgi:hypothetical protein